MALAGRQISVSDRSTACCVHSLELSEMRGRDYIESGPVGQNMAITMQSGLSADASDKTPTHNEAPPPHGIAVEKK